MDIPKQIKIGGHVYDVEMDPKLYLTEGSPGTILHFAKKIAIDPNTAESYQAECLLHEIIEALNRNNELDLAHTQITALSEGLFQVLRDNRLDFSVKSEREDVFITKDGPKRIGELTSDEFREILQCMFPQ
jgi:hypothetical protein